MLSAQEAPFDDVLQATIKVADKLLASPEATQPQARYIGDVSSNVTGYQGVSVFLFATSRCGLRLQVRGHARLIQAVVGHYARFQIAARTPGQVTFAIS